MVLSSKSADVLELHSLSWVDFHYVIWRYKYSGLEASYYASWELEYRHIASTFPHTSTLTCLLLLLKHERKSDFLQM